MINWEDDQMASSFRDTFLNHQAWKYTWNLPQRQEDGLRSTKRDSLFERNLNHRQNRTISIKKVSQRVAEPIEVETDITRYLEGEYSKKLRVGFIRCRYIRLHLEIGNFRIQKWCKEALSAEDLRVHPNISFGFAFKRIASQLVLRRKGLI